MPEPEALERDTRLADAFFAPKGTQAGAPREVLLTGVTGFLGSELARTLLRATEARLHCLVRPKPDVPASERLAAACRRLGTDPERVLLVEGDLEAGIAPKPELESIDTIVHGAATVNLFAPYAALRTSNVLGARAVLEFASSFGPKAVHFVSTTGVFLSPRYRKATVFELDPVEGHDGLKNGYAQSKWVADTMMTRARQRGFDVSVYRPAFVGWHSRTGRAGEHDLVALLLGASIAAECAPTLDLQINSSPVDHVAEAVARLVVSPTARGGTYHLANRRALPFVELAEMAELPVADLTTWRDAVAARAPRFAKFAAMVHASASDETSGGIELYWEHDRTYDDSRTREALGVLYSPPPPFDAAYLDPFSRRVEEHFAASRGTTPESLVP